VRHEALWMRAGVRPAPSFRRSGTAEAGGSWVRRVGRVWWRAAPTTTGRTGTTGRCGSGKRDGKVDARSQRSHAPQEQPPAQTRWIWAGSRRAPAPSSRGGELLGRFDGAGSGGHGEGLRRNRGEAAGV
jgi:hypothetical protein